MYYGWKPYVPVAERRRQAQRKMESLRKKGMDIQPVTIEGRKIAKTFWGAAWCDHLESFSDYENRLPRGRTYVRNGSVCHLAIARGKIDAKVSGSELYDVSIQIKTLPRKKWGNVKRRCAGQIGSLIELLQGRLSSHVMQAVTQRKTGLFPLPDEISLGCSCPDWAVMCKHVAAVLYGVGARLDEKPELLFTLRGVDHEELIAADAEAAVSASTTAGTSKRLATGDLSDVFGIEIEAGDPEKPARKKRGSKSRNAKPKKITKATTKTKKTSTNPKPKTKKARKTTKKATTKKKTSCKSPKKKAATETIGKKAAKKRTSTNKQTSTMQTSTMQTSTKKTSPKKRTSTKKRTTKKSPPKPAKRATA